MEVEKPQAAGQISREIPFFFCVLHLCNGTRILCPGFPPPIHPFLSVVRINLAAHVRRSPLEGDTKYAHAWLAVNFFSPSLSFFIRFLDPCSRIVEPNVHELIKVPASEGNERA